MARQKRDLIYDLKQSFKTIIQSDGDYARARALIDRIFGPPSETPVARAQDSGNTASEEGNRSSNSPATEFNTDEVTKVLQSESRIEAQGDEAPESQSMEHTEATIGTSGDASGTVQASSSTIIQRNHAESTRNTSKIPSDGPEVGTSSDANASSTSPLGSIPKDASSPPQDSAVADPLSSTKPISIHVWKTAAGKFKLGGNKSGLTTPAPPRTSSKSNEFKAGYELFTQHPYAPRKRQWAEIEGGPLHADSSMPIEQPASPKAAESKKAMFPVQEEDVQGPSKQDSDGDVGMANTEVPAETEEDANRSPSLKDQHEHDGNGDVNMADLTIPAESEEDATRLSPLNDHEKPADAEPAPMKK